MKKAISILLVTCMLVIAACRYDVEQGLSCPTPVTVTYTNTIAGIINTYGCTGSDCHGGSNPPAGFYLTDYNAVKAKVTDGRLFGAINHSPGFVAMPQNASKMDPCDIAKVKAWIDAGAPQ